VATKSKRSLKIKKRLEELGHTSVHVWWEKIGPAVEMCGPSGGYMYSSDHTKQFQTPIGLSFDEAMQNLDAPWHRVKEV
jgi:hypothetical protein